MKNMVIITGLIIGCVCWFSLWIRIYLDSDDEKWYETITFCLIMSYLPIIFGVSYIIGLNFK